MPRHRKPRVPMLNALHVADEPASAAGVRAALAEAERTEIAAAEQDSIDTIRMPRVIVAVGRHSKAKLRRAKEGLLRSGARTVLVSPWSAIGAGLVIAMALLILSPHVELNSQNGAVGKTLCEPGCMSPDPGTLNTIAPGQGLSPNQGGVPATQGGAVMQRMHGLKFEFTVLSQHGSEFMAMVSVFSKHPIKSWKLTFTFRDAKILNLAGASWDANRADNGGTATPYPWQGDGGYQADQGSQGYLPIGWTYRQARDRPAFVFFVIGTGTPDRPGTCRFNGQTCRFKLLPSMPPGHW